MSQLNIGIGIRLDMGKALGNGAGVDPQTPIAAWSPGWLASGGADIDLFYPMLQPVVGLDTDMYFDEGSIAPALSNAAARLVSPDSFAIPNANQWIEWYDYGDWTGAGDYAGCTVRHQKAANTYYCFWHDVDDYQLFKVVAGAKTVLQSGAITPSAGDVWRLEVNGTALTVYRNGVEFESDTDSSISIAGKQGVNLESFAIANRIGRFSWGDLPFNDADQYKLYAGFVPNHYLRVGVEDHCGWANVASMFDMRAVLDTGHLAAGTNPHWFEIDLEEVQLVGRVRHYGSSSGVANHNWLAVNIEMKLNSGDDWTTVATGVSFNCVGETITRWRYSDPFTPFKGRYIKITITDTEGTEDGASSREFEVCSALESDFWYLADTLRHEELWGAWRGKGANSYNNARVTNHLYDYGTARRLNQAVGVVPWTEGAGWAFDGTNFLDSRFIADGTDHTIIARFNNADGSGALPVLGDAVGPGGINIVGATATSILVANQSTGDVINVPAVGDDMVIAMAGDQYYLDGVSQGTLTGYSAASGSVNVFLGGVSGVAGSGTMVACAIYEGKLTATEVAAITTKMQAL